MPRFIVERNEYKIVSTVSRKRRITIGRYAAKLGMSISVMIRVALKEYLDNHFPGWEEQEQNEKEN